MQLSTTGILRNTFFICAALVSCCFIAAQETFQKAVIEFQEVPKDIKLVMDPENFEKIRYFNKNIEVTTKPLPTNTKTPIAISFEKQSPQGKLRTKSIIEVTGGEKIIDKRWVGK